MSISLINNALHTLRNLLNRLLPFTDPKAPLIQDVIHALALIALMYFAPKLTATISEQRRQTQEEHAPQTQEERVEEEAEEIPLFEYERGDDAGHGNREPHMAGNDEIEGLNGEPEDWIRENIVPRIPPDDAGFPPRHQALVEEEDDDDAEFDDILRDLPAAAFQAAPQPQNQAGQTQRRAQRTNLRPKKAASLARRDQRRQYHEFHRQEAHLQRLREQEGAEEREEALLEEKRRRAVAEIAVEERMKQERETKKAAEEAERRMELQRREAAVKRLREDLDRKGYVELRHLGENEWAKGVVKASGVLGTRGEDGKKTVTMITEGNCVVRVDEGLMEEAYRRATEQARSRGTMSFEEFGRVLEGVLVGG
jgi:hypothetical protein